jgi:phospholipase/carboxylesterase
MTSFASSARPFDRRQALRHLAIGAAGLFGACKLGPSPEFTEPSNGRLAARPGAQTGFPSAGASPLLLDPLRDGRLYVPPGLTDGTPAPLIVALHGASGNGQAMVTALQPLADQLGFVMLCPDSRDVTWDAIRYLYADDVRFIDSALAHTFGRCHIDPQRIGIAGFSDGASYALGLGRLNGDLFKRIVAFSPGTLLTAIDSFKPPVYITHGYQDQVLPMDVTSIPIVEELEARGYDVTFRQFDGGHWIPAAYAPEALGFLINYDENG